VDTLTHALSGALAARLTAGRDAPARSLPRRVAAGFLACAFPDLDFVIGFLGPVQYLLHHRGVTHSVLMLPLWSFVVAWLLAKLLREPGGWRALYGVAALALGVHIAGDLITSFGTMILAPVSDWRAGLGTTFIIDLWFSGIIVAGLAGSVLWGRSRLPALAASLALVGYVGAQGLLKQRALEFGERYAAAQGLRGAAVSAQARPVSPFNWTVFVADGDTVRSAHVNLVRAEPRAAAPDAGFIARLNAAYLPLAAAHWQTHSRFGDTPAARALAREAWGSPGLAFFRWFAEAPVLDGVTEGSTCVWFVDLRFLTPGRETMPFRYGACRDAPGGPWRAYRRLGENERIRVDSTVD
jgi:inner membrane protein